MLTQESRGDNIDRGGRQPPATPAIPAPPITPAPTPAITPQPNPTIEPGRDIAAASQVEHQPSLAEVAKLERWNTVVRSSEFLAYSSTAVVFGAAGMSVVDAVSGIDTFRILHDSPILATIGTAAHVAVIFLAASGGLGLARFRASQSELAELTELMSATYNAHSHALDKIAYQIEPLIAWSKDLSDRTRTVRDILSTIGSVGPNAAEKDQIEALCKSVIQVSMVFRYLGGSFLKRSLETENLELVIKHTERLPDKVSEAGQKLDAVTTYLEKLAGSTPLTSEQELLFNALHELTTRIASIAECLEPRKEDSPPRTLSISVDPKDLMADLKTLSTHADRWKLLHKQLHEQLPKVVSGEGVFEIRDLLHSITTLKDLIDSEGWPNSERAIEEAREIANLALRLQSRANDFNLTPNMRSFLNTGVESIVALTQKTTLEDALEQIAISKKALEQLETELTHATPVEDSYAKFRNRLFHQIQEFSDRYPNLAIRASVAGLFSAVSYWMCCSAMLDSIIPTTHMLRDSSGVLKEHLKYAAPFALYSGIVFTAGVLNHKFRPLVAWTSLKLSAWTFKAVAPLAWGYQLAHDTGSKVIDKISAFFVRGHFGPKNGAK
ncbi:MAG: hypothetical protein KDD53_02215 [Bdellovibrionales bacterium]|nr:hypothetical protein [Bdellovibrionales bacterium]